LARLAAFGGFTFVEADISDRDAILGLGAVHAGIDRVIHLAAQAGVRYSLTNPFAYIQSNVLGHTVMLELARALKTR
ncbi:GDP-mannose 4,6-dehydratase, partial [Enterococcus faecium]